VRGGAGDQQVRPVSASASEASTWWCSRCRGAPARRARTDLRSEAGGLAVLSRGYGVATRWEPVSLGVAGGM